MKYIYITPKKVLETASEITEKPIDKILDSNRFASNVAVRDLCFKICKDHLGMVDRDIADFFQRDRSSITYGLKRVEKNLARTNQYKAMYENIKERLKL
jgi:chromosomal replication initiation ATPase DnaA